jgi:general secretion pathway protein H
MRRQRPPAAAGFTLVEVLVTLFVIAALAGLAVVRLGDRDRGEALDTEARRLAHLIELAREEAILDGREWGFVLDGRRYGFVRLDEEDGRWRPVEERPFRARTLPEGMGLRLGRSGGDRVGGADAGDFLAAQDGRRPALLLLSSGEMTPFELRVDDLAGGAPARRLHSDGFERVALARVDAAGDRS